MKSSGRAAGRTLLFEWKGGINVDSAGGSHLEVAGAVAMDGCVSALDGSCGLRNRTTRKKKA